MDKSPKNLGVDSASMYHVERLDPLSELVDRGRLTKTDIEQVNRIMTAIATLRAAEERLTQASLDYMKLNKTDMRALHFLIVSQNAGAFVTPRDLADHLHVSTASVTKMLDRLESGNHITRSQHPYDRRSQLIHITTHTHQAAMRTVGKQHSHRFTVAVKRSPQERIVIAQFLEEMAQVLEVNEADWYEA